MKIKIERLELEDVEDYFDAVQDGESDREQADQGFRSTFLTAMLQILAPWLQSLIAPGSRPATAEEAAGMPLAGAAVYEEMATLLRKKGWRVEPPDETQEEFLDRVRKEAATGKHGAPADPEPPGADPEFNEPPPQ